MATKRKNIPSAVERLLWGRAAGRCEFKGCNIPLFAHIVTGTIDNYAQKAHILAVNKGGARYEEIPEEEKNKIENLMLVCPQCHITIDRDEDKYPPELLFQMKYKHEERIFTLTGIGTEMKSHMIYYTANLANSHLSVNDGDAKNALIASGRYPSEFNAIDLSHHGSYVEDRDENYYAENVKNLERAVNRRVIDIVEQGNSIALFSIAPQPLLIYLGYLLNDKYNVFVFQSHRRENNKWQWNNEYTSVDFQIIPPKQIKSSGKIAIIIALSSSVKNNRITNVLGENTNIYTLTIENPNRIFVTHPAIMDSFIEHSRSLLETIKQTHGNYEQVHMFPVMPVSLAVRFGMDYMSKADNPVLIYDEIAGKGFVPSLRIGGQNDN